MVSSVIGDQMTNMEMIYHLQNNITVEKVPEAGGRRKEGEFNYICQEQMF